MRRNLTGFHADTDDSAIYFFTPTGAKIGVAVAPDVAEAQRVAEMLQFAVDNGYGQRGTGRSVRAASPRQPKSNGHAEVRHRGRKCECGELKQRKTGKCRGCDQLYSKTRYKVLMELTGHRSPDTASHADNVTSKDAARRAVARRRAAKASPARDTSPN